MSDILDTDVAPFCHGRNHSGSVPVPTVGVAAVCAPEVSLVQFESLGSRETSTARRCRVRGPDHHHLPPGPHGTLDKFALGRTDRSVSRLTRHGRLGQKLRLEVLDGDQIMLVDNMFGPYSGVVDGSPGGFLRQSGGLSLGVDVAPRLRACLAVTPGHRALCFRQLGGASPAVTEMRQIEGWVGGRRRGGHTPVDPDATPAASRGCGLAADDEGGIPMPETVPADADRSRLGWQFSRPDDRDRDALGQYQTTLTKRERSFRVLQRRQGSPAGLHLRATTL